MPLTLTPLLCEFKEMLPRDYVEIVIVDDLTTV